MTRHFRFPSDLRLTAPTDGAAMVGLVGGVDTVRGRTVRNAAVHLSVGLTAATLAPRQLDTETQVEVKALKHHGFLKALVPDLGEKVRTFVKIAMIRETEKP